MSKTLAFRQPAVPADRGRLLTAEEVATELLRGKVTGAWVRRNISCKIRLGRRTVLYYEADVRAFLEARRGA